MKEFPLWRVVLVPAVLGAYLGCDAGKDLEFSSQTPDPAWQPKVERTAEITPTAKIETATATPVPTPNPIVPESTPTSQPKPDINEAVPESAQPFAQGSPRIARTSEQAQVISCDAAWEQNFRPTFLTISGIQFSSEIQSVQSIHLAENLITWPVPDYGIATSADHRIYSIHIFGHSSWGGIRSPFADIEFLEAGNPIEVRNEANEPFCFEVTGFALADKNQASYLGDYSDPKVILQTTARYNGSWILNRENILGKVGHDEQSTALGDLAFLVFAKKK